MPVRIKICGITNLADAEVAIAEGADALGFILYEKSKRFIRVEDAIRIVEKLPPFVSTVAVTVNAVKEFTNLSWRKQLKNFNVAQLHGEESPQHAKAVSKYLPVIKVFPADPHIVSPANTVSVVLQAIETANKAKDTHAQLKEEMGREPTLPEVSAKMGLPTDPLHPVVNVVEAPDEPQGPRAADFQSFVAAFMLDTPSAERGGTGRVFDWNLAVEFKKRIGAKPLVLSGGLNPENVAKAIELVHPYAVDVSSGVEASPGRKDYAKLRDFIQICKSL